MFADMKRYIALLRGINISGKNKVPMAELKKGFETLAFVEVKTYLNSGNVIFSSDEDNIRKLTDKIEEMIKNQFGLDIPVFVLSREALEDILQNAPDWWGSEDKEIYDNLIFIIPPAAFSDVYPLLRSCKASAHIPEWRRLEMEAAAAPEPTKPAP